jgi:hypothetical protein
MRHHLLGLGALAAVAGCPLPTNAPSSPAPDTERLEPRTNASQGPPQDSGTHPPGTARPSALGAEPDTAVLGGYAVFHGLGVFHGDEVPARDGERWQAIVSSPSGAALESVRLRVEVARDEVVDPADGPFTGRRVTTPASVVHASGGVEDPATLFVRREAGPLPAGPVPVAAASDTTYLQELGAHDLPLDGAVYTLTVAADSSAGGVVRQWRISLSAPGGATQPVTVVPNRDGGHPRLLWAGDLDADGRLDLVLDESWHYNLTVASLYLSSEAAPGALLRRVARHETSGC